MSFFTINVMKHRILDAFILWYAVLPGLLNRVLHSRMSFWLLEPVSGPLGFQDHVPFRMWGHSWLDSPYNGFFILVQQSKVHIARIITLNAPFFFFCLASQYINMTFSFYTYLRLCFRYKLKT